MKVISQCCSQGHTRRAHLCTELRRARTETNKVLLEAPVTPRQSEIGRVLRCRGACVSSQRGPCAERARRRFNSVGSEAEAP